MKRIILLVCLAAMVSEVRAATQYRDFTSAEGKTIRGCIKAYDAQTQTVTIERENRRISKAPIALFCEADQTYILEWDAAKGFMSDNLLKIKCDEKRIGQRKEKDVRDVPFVGGGTEEIQLCETIFEKIAYDIQLRNMNKSALDNMRAVYIIYYEQSKITANKKPVVKQKHHKAELSVPALDVRQNETIITESVEIHNDNVNAVNWADGSVYTGGKGEVHGLRVRLYMKMPSGNEVMREFSFPEKLSEEEFPWKD